MTNLSAHFADQRQHMVDLLTEMVKVESPSSDKAAVDRMGAFIKHQFETAGATVDVHPRADVGDILLAKWNIAATGKPLLILSHMDTVWDVGTLAEMPIHHDDDGRMYGPGIVDMKGGIVIALTAITGLRDLAQLPDRPIWYMVTSDEEIGSLHARDLIEDTAQQCDLVLVTEPPLADGSLKTWRKGTAAYEIAIDGRAAHAGNEPEQGVNSIIEFAQHALELNQLNDFKNGISVSVTVVKGGTATNVIPAKTRARVDVRTVSDRDYQRVHETIMDRAPYIPGATVTVTQLSHRPPMERDGDAFGKVQAIAEGVGITVREDGAGGGSDGNFTAALGIPTIDGLGAEGGGLHADHEHVLVNSLPKKATLMAALLRDW